MQAPSPAAESPSPAGGAGVDPSTVTAILDAQVHCAAYTFFSECCLHFESNDNVNVIVSDFGCTGASADGAPGYSSRLCTLLLLRAAKHKHCALNH